MYAIAIIGDLIGMIPIVNIVSDFGTGFTLWMIGSDVGLNLYSSDRILGTLAAAGIKFVPLLSILPAWTVRVYLAKKIAAAEQAKV